MTEENKKTEKQCDIHVVVRQSEQLCDHPEDELIQTNGYRVLCLKCGRNTN
jgi:hypothetical protein